MTDPSARSEMAHRAEPVLLLEPRDGTPVPVADATALAVAVDRFAAGHGPVAVDAERASGHRYGQRAYLVQLRRVAVGTTLIDPIACPDLSELGRALGDAEWVLHAASQDLACLADVGLRPRRLFDTELAARLAGMERVGLGALAERLVGYRLEKGHSAVDWSTRPVPEAWLTYAALDVELLIDLRDALEAELRRQGKLAWALEEFAALVAAPAPAPRPDPWRRTSGIHRVRTPRGLAVVRELWQARDRIARRRDIAPGRILPDSAIVAVAAGGLRSARELLALPGLGGRAARRDLTGWLAALDRAWRLEDAALPPATLSSGLPPTPRWRDREPAAASRLSAAKAMLAAMSAEHTIPVENLLPPEAVRRLTWRPPQPADAESVARALRGYGARGWQVGLTAAPLATALAEPGLP